MNRPPIVVSGFGRCGSSLTMQMLAAGGVPCVGEPPDFEVSGAAHRIAPEFIASCAGQAVKILDPHRVGLPGEMAVVWLDRNTREQAASHAKFAHAALGREYDRKQRRALQRQLEADLPRALREIDDRLLLRIDFGLLVMDPKHHALLLRQRLKYLGYDLDAEAAAAVVIRRPPQCMPTMHIERLLVVREAARKAGGV